MTYNKLKESILNNLNTFDTLLRKHFSFQHAEVLHNNMVDYKGMKVDTDFLCITLHSCAEIQDYIFISLDKNASPSHELKLIWDNTPIYLHQWIDEMD